MWARSSSAEPYCLGWGLFRAETVRGSEMALGPGAAAVNRARCRGRPGQGTRC